MIDMSMLATPPLVLTEEDFKGTIQKGPNCIRDICWKFEFPNAWMLLNKKTVVQIATVLCWKKKEFQVIFPRSCDEECITFRALKCQLTGKNVVHKQEIYPALVNRAL